MSGSVWQWQLRLPQRLERETRLPGRVGPSAAISSVSSRRRPSKFTAVEGLLPPRPVDEQPLGCHRPRIPDKVYFTWIVYRLALGCSWREAAATTRAALDRGTHQLVAVQPRTAPTQHRPL